MANNNEQPSPGLELIRASEVQPREIDRLWYPFIPYGKVTLLQGEAGEPLTVIYQTKEGSAAATSTYSHTRPDGTSRSTATDCIYTAENIHRITVQTAEKPKVDSPPSAFWAGSVHRSTSRT